jgi:hypothetical protein
MLPAISGFTSKLDLLTVFTEGRTVLHLGAVGETCGDTQLRVDRIGQSVHAHLTKVAKRCVGVDYDEPSVTAIRDSGQFDNIICADVTELRREDIPLDHIDVVVAGDTIEHLSNPGDLLDVVAELSDPGTRLVLTTPNALGAVIFFRHLRGQAVEGLDHVTSFNRFSLGNLLTRHGWTIHEMWTCYQPNAEQSRSSLAFRAGRALFQRVPLIGGTLAVVATHDSGSAQADQ